MYAIGEYTDAVDETLDRWEQDSMARRLWEQDASLWTGGDEDRWLGWLAALEAQSGELSAIGAAASSLHSEGIEHLLLLGFNGSGWLGYIGTPLSYEQGGYEIQRGPAPSPEDEQRMIDAGIKNRTIGRARLNTGLEIVEKTAEVLKRLAR